jgi:hypothetical protein
MFGLGMYVFFPTFILKFDTTTDCHLRNEPIGCRTTLDQLTYVQPKSLQHQSASTAMAPLSTPAVIEPNKNDNTDITPTYASHWPKKPPSPPVPKLDLTHLPPPAYSISLKGLDWEALIQCLYTLEAIGLLPMPDPPPLLPMSTDKIVGHLHPTGSQPPPIWPYDTPNALETKSHWTSEELYCITGCHHFCNYKHLVSVNKDFSFTNGGEFPVSLGAYTTIPKAPHGAPIDPTSCKYLDVVHINIAFWDCASVGGFKYALIFVDYATRYNWCFGLKSLNLTTSLRYLRHFGWKPSPWLVNFGVIVMTNYSEAMSVPSSTQIICPFWQALQVVNHPTVL